MRETRRFEIRCPVTVHISDRANGKRKVQGVLYDIGVSGARLAVEQPLPPGAKITLFVHFRAPDNQVTTIRFEGIVQRLHGEPQFEIAVSFKGTGRFLENQLSDLYVVKAAHPDEGA